MLHNAAKYTADGGDIALKVEVDRGSVSVRVRDNGIGIDPELLPHVFEPFTQGYAGSTAAKAGWAWVSPWSSGSWSCTRQVEISSDGSARARNSVSLPCISEVSRRRFSLGRRLRGRGKRVLVSTTTPTPPRRLRVLLASKVTTSDGHGRLQALSCFESFAPQVAIIDIGLPGMDGYELAAGIRANRTQPTPLLIALTGYGQAEDFDRSRDAGFDHHFVKPAELRAIQAAIDGLEDDADVEERRTQV